MEYSSHWLPSVLRTCWIRNVIKINKLKPEGQESDTNLPQFYNTNPP